METYTFEEAMASTREYFNNDSLAAKVWINKYAIKDSYGNLYERTPEDMHRRIAREIARIESRYESSMTEEEIFHLLDHFRYLIPQGSPMMGIGNSQQVASLSNCFVIGLDGPSDSYGAIMKIDEEQIQLMKRRGGVGHDMSHIRPQGSMVKNSSLTATGIVPFMERYARTTREVSREGRRGALMLTVSLRHPDSEDFIDAKNNNPRTKGVSIALKIDDEFMKAQMFSREYEQRFPCEGDEVQVTKSVSAAPLWKKITQSILNAAEPEILFWDTIRKESIADCYDEDGFRSVSTNPLGQIPLCPYDSCRLLAINLWSYVNNPFGKDASFNMELFKIHISKAMRIMDDIIDLEIEKINQILEKIDSDPEDDDTKATERNLWKKILEKTIKGRRTGLGITGEADMLAAMGLRYGTKEATEFSVNIHRTLALEAYRESVNLAMERGAFPIYDRNKEKDNPFIRRIMEADGQIADRMARYGRRNIACLTIAPTGSTSILAQTSSGIEPVFMPVYKRRRKLAPTEIITDSDYIDEIGDAFEEHLVFHHHLQTWMAMKGYDICRDYTPEEMDSIISESPYYMATSEHVDCFMKVKMQGAIQKWVDQAISMTINLPESSDEDIVHRVLTEAWRCGCKGCTIYREGSKAGKLHSAASDYDEDAKMPIVTPVRPKILDCDVVRFQNNKEKWVAFVGLLDNYPYEIFTGLQDDDEGISLPKSVTRGRIIKNFDEMGNKRYDFQFENKRGYKTTVEGLSEKFNKEYWNYAKLISGVLRYRVPVNQIIKMVDSLEFDSESINTWKNGVERALKKYVKDGTENDPKSCPRCGSTLIYQEGSLICKECGFPNNDSL